MKKKKFLTRDEWEKKTSVSFDKTVKEIFKKHYSTPFSKKVHKITKSKEWDKYFISQEDFLEISEDKIENICSIYEPYRYHYYCEKDDSLLKMGFALKSKDRNQFKSDEEHRNHMIENNLNVMFAVILYYGGNRKNTPLLEEIYHMKELLSKGDFSTLSWCLFGVIPRYDSFLLRTADSIIKKKRFEALKGVNKSKEKRLEKAKPLKDKFIEIYKKGILNNEKSPTIYKKFRIWCWEKGIPKKDTPTTKTLHRWKNDILK